MANRPYHPRGKLVLGLPVKGHPLYQVWFNMLTRCSNPKSVGYENYGGRGITVCERWQAFENFAGDMGFKPDRSFTLERVDVNGNYEPANCKWASRSDQCLNRRVFSNSASGVTGVIFDGKRWIARMDYGKKRHTIGWFNTETEAADARAKFQSLFQSNPDAAIASINTGLARSNSLTGERGVNPHADGGFIVRLTVAGERIYLGYFKTLEDACRAKRNYLASKTS